MSLVLGVDIGGTKITVGLVDGDGRVSRRASTATPALLGPAAVIASVAQLSSEVTSFSDVTRVIGCGVGSAGLIDPKSGSVTFATSALPGWAGTAIAADLREILRMPVEVVNDVHAHAAGEAGAGAGRGAETMLMIAAGTGIGGALVVGGAVQIGARGASGNLGHLPSAEARQLACTCGGEGHLEAVSSGPAIQLRYLTLGGDVAAVTARDVFALAESGDSRAIDAVDAAAFALGRGVGGLINALDPDVVVIGGGLSDSGDRWWTALRRGIDHDVIPLLSSCPVVAAELGADAALVGAAMVFRARLDTSTRTGNTRP